MVYVYFCHALPDGSGFREACPPPSLEGEEAGTGPESCTWKG